MNIKQPPCALLCNVQYEPGMDEGLREQERNNSKHSKVDGSWKSWRLFGGKGGGGNDN